MFFLAKIDGFEIGIGALGVLFFVILISFYVRNLKIAAIVLLGLLVLSGFALIKLTKLSHVNENLVMLVFIGTLALFIFGLSILTANYQIPFFDNLICTSRETILEVTSKEVTSILLCRRKNCMFKPFSYIKSTGQSHEFKRILRKSKAKKTYLPRINLPVGRFLSFIKDIEEVRTFTSLHTDAYFLLIETPKGIICVNIVVGIDDVYINGYKANTNITAILNIF